MKKLSLITLFILFNTILFSQNTYQIEGVIKDSLSKQSIPFVSVSLQKNSCKGTISNGDGHFIFKISAEDIDDNLLVGCMSYNTKSFPINNLFNKNNIIYLQLSTKMLNEVEVKSFSTPEALLEEVAKRISVNYKIDSIPLITAYFRHCIYLDNKLSRFSETCFDSYDKDFKKHKSKLKNNINILKSRFIIRNDSLSKRSKYDLNANLLVPFFNIVPTLINWPFFEKKKWGNYIVKMNYISNVQHPYYEVIFKDKKLTDNKSISETTITIDAIDLAISKYIVKTKSYDSTTWAANSNIICEYNYKKANNIWVPSYYKEVHWFDWYTKTKIYTKAEYIPTNINYNINDVDHFINTTQKIDLRTPINEVSKDSFDDAFWLENNFLPIEDKLKEEIDELKKLEK